MNYPAAYDHADAHLFRIGLAPIPASDWFEGPFDVADGPPRLRKLATFAQAPDQSWGETHRSRPSQSEALGLMEQHLGISSSDTNLPPLQAASLLVDDDLCLMEKLDGAWTLTAASLCAPSFFSAADVVGRSLDTLHAPVTGFGQRLLPRVARIFDNLPAEQIVERRNWSVVASGELFLPDDRPVRSGQRRIPLEAAGDALFVRMERQTLRRLSRTGGLLFTIRIWRHPLSVMRNQPARLTAFAQAWDKVMQPDGQDFRDYKQLAALDPMVRSFLTGVGLD